MLRQIGAAIKLARKRHGLTINALAINASIARSTLALVEKGSPNVSVAIYVQVLFLLGFEKELLSIHKRQAFNFRKSQTIGPINSYQFHNFHLALSQYRDLLYMRPMDNDNNILY